MTKTFILAAALAAALSGSAFAQSYNPDFGTGNVSRPAQATDQGLEAHAQVIDSRHQALKPTFTNQERALFNRVPLED